MDLTDEYEHYKVWTRNKHYMETRRDDVDFDMELNKFADGLDDVKSRNQVLSRQTCEVSGYGEPRKGMLYDKYMSVMDFTLPNSIDHRESNWVTKVKDQGSCGSCWTFSATGSIEGQYAKKYGKLVEFSESQILDCDVNGEDDGCQGGLVDGAFKYLENTESGLETESSYPYVPQQQFCHLPNTIVTNFTSVAMVKNFIDVPNFHAPETHLKHAVATVGPISVGIDASHMDFQMYKSGIYYNSDCSSTTLDHAVLVVGYGTDTSKSEEPKPYWIVKNSWGNDWGMNGYVHMSRNNGNNCGIASQASYPVLQ